MLVDILDVGSGNINSIKNWVERVNVSAMIVTNPSKISSKMLILPGVGSAGPYMERLKRGGYDKAIQDHISKGGRILGICLGFQILSSYTEEDGGVEGLQLIDGRVERIKGPGSHTGWESLSLRKNQMRNQSFNGEMKLNKKIVLDGRVFYNHEYAFINDDVNSFSVPISKDLPQYSGLLVKNKIIGAQFHPEKSQVTGLNLISMML